MLFRPDHVRNLHVVIVNHGSKVIEARAVGALDNMVLFAGPFDPYFATNQIVENELPLARHEQPHDSLPSLGLEAPRICVRFRAKFTTINKWPTGRLSRIALGLEF